MNGESAHVCMHVCSMSSKKFKYAVNVRILEWSWHGENIVYFLYVVDSNSNMLGKFYLGQWRIYEVACVQSEKICCFLRMDMLKLNLKLLVVFLNENGRGMLGKCNAWVEISIHASLFELQDAKKLYV